MTQLPKFLQRRLDGFRWPMLLICAGKHDTDYYVLKDAEALYRACLKILKDRIEVDYIVKPDDKPTLRPEYPLDLATLTERLRIEEEHVRSVNRRAKKQWEEDIAEWTDVQRAIKENDGALAWRILESRSGAKYEGFELHRLEAP